MDLIILPADLLQAQPGNYTLTVAGYSDRTAFKLQLLVPTSDVLQVHTGVVIILNINKYNNDDDDGSHNENNRYRRLVTPLSLPPTMTDKHSNTNSSTKDKGWGTCKAGIRSYCCRALQVPSEVEYIKSIVHQCCDGNDTEVSQTCLMLQRATAPNRPWQYDLCQQVEGSLHAVCPCTRVRVCVRVCVLAFSCALVLRR